MFLCQDICQSKETHPAALKTDETSSSTAPTKQCRWCYSQLGPTRAKIQWIDIQTNNKRWHGPRELEPEELVFSVIFPCSSKLLGISLNLKFEFKSICDRQKLLFCFSFQTVLTAPFEQNVSFINFFVCAILHTVHTFSRSKSKMCSNLIWLNSNYAGTTVFQSLNTDLCLLAQRHIQGNRQSTRKPTFCSQHRVNNLDLFLNPSAF